MLAAGRAHERPASRRGAATDRILRADSSTFHDGVGAAHGVRLRSERTACKRPNGGDIHPATKADAIVQAIDLIVVQRKSVDLGLGQVNSGNLASLGLSVADALDPCKNLAAAAKILSAGYITASQTQADPQQALRTALSRYNTGDPARGFANGYVGKVERSAQYVVPAISVATAATETPAGPTAPVQPVQSQPLPPSWDAFGMASLHSASAFAPPDNSVPAAAAPPTTSSVFPTTAAPAAPPGAGQAVAAAPVVLRAAD